MVIVGSFKRYCFIFCLLCFLVILSVGVITLSHWIYVKEVARLIDVGEDVFQQLNITISERFRHFLEEITFLLETPELKEFVENDFRLDGHVSEVQSLFLRFASLHQEFHRARIIAHSGWEVMRVDRSDDGIPVLALPQELQYRGDSYYFNKTIEFSEGEFYFSPLNVEDDKIIIQIATPLFDSAGKKKGIVVLDIYAKTLFYPLSTKLFLSTDKGQWFVLTPEGKFDICETCEFDELLQVEQLRLKKFGRGLIFYQMMEPWPGWRLMVVKEMPSDPLYIFRLQLILGATMGFNAILVLVFIIFAYFLRQTRRLNRFQRGMIYSLTLLAEERDQETANHLERVQRYSVCLAQELRKDPRYRQAITKEFITNLSLAGPLHDIGKVGVPDYVLHKQGSLNKEERRLMEMHVRIGSQILERLIRQFGLKERYLWMAKNICAYHHERYDGTGYPEGLKGEEIPLEARIFAVADAYDAIRSKRPYKGPLSHEEAVRRIKEGAGRYFDPRVVEAFLRCEKEFQRISESFKDN